MNISNYEFKDFGVSFGEHYLNNARCLSSNSYSDYVAIFLNPRERRSFFTSDLFLKGRVSYILTLKSLHNSLVKKLKVCWFNDHYFNGG